MSSNNLYNNVYETSIRILVIVNGFKRDLELQELVYFDYLLTHAGDFNPNIKSVHPANPGHNREVYSRRELIKESLELLLRKHLIKVNYNKQGFKYTNSLISREFLNYFTSEYFNTIVESAKLISMKFNDKSLKEIEDFMKGLLATSKDEYEQEVLFRGGYFE